MSTKYQDEIDKLNDFIKAVDEALSRAKLANYPSYLSEFEAKYQTRRLMQGVQKAAGSK